ncbi:MAG: glycosyltransferase [Bacteroidetes bacterium]|nr:glycosyltransferase [Bacteroidota bacterium]
MKNEMISNKAKNNISSHKIVPLLQNPVYNRDIPKEIKREATWNNSIELAEILFITSYPPRECGIATYSQDLIGALNNKFNQSLQIKVCALESGEAGYQYPHEVKYVLKTSKAEEYNKLSLKINEDNSVKIVMVQHEFGFFRLQENVFLEFLDNLNKPVVIVFHTVLPNPDSQLKRKVENIAAACESIIVMTHHSCDILVNDYQVPRYKITVIAHGTHLVPHLSKDFLKNKYQLSGRKILTTFGLLSSGKSIETTIDALPAVVRQCPEVMFLVIGKTHPEVKKAEGEKYRQKLEELVELHSLEDHVLFINDYLALPDLLEYLQLTDIYVFSTNDPNQAVSGTFAYAMSCACPIISTPIPHAKEVLNEETGIIFDFCNSTKLSEGVIRLLSDEPLRRSISSNTLQNIVSTAWENSSVLHAVLFEKISDHSIILQYNLPEINLRHLKKMTTKTGIIQFSKISQPDIRSGYTLDDNARALIACCMYFKETSDTLIMHYIRIYFRFIKHCLTQEGVFLNYVDENRKFTSQNNASNLDDAHGRAIWALGYLVSLTELISEEIITEAKTVLEQSLVRVEYIHSTRAMAFAIKGLYYYQRVVQSERNVQLITTLANRLVQMFKHEAARKWEWFESYLTYANSILPEALLFAWLITSENIYKDVAISSLKFLLNQTFNRNGIEVVSNRKWLQKGQEAGHYGEQPIDVAYTVMTLSQFYDVFKDKEYRLKMEIAFNWFLGSNRLHQIIYNPCTGGCYDGLEETHVNLNQGAESTVSYLMARFTMEKYNTAKPQTEHDYSIMENSNIS